ncbi:MAG TPA: Crp/Fnr family transcriptional regulator [Thermoanaerobaculia bacterium]|nr:Crp/Fnr family transcriptional regulator [Thermoanaerobaculia bacterium]
MSAPLQWILRTNPLYRRLSDEDRQRLAEVATLRTYPRGSAIFSEGDASELLYTIADGRVKLVKMLPGGKDVILEILGPGDPLGAVAVYEQRPYPASAEALEPTTCIALQRRAFFTLLETCPSLVRGLLVGLNLRLIELTQRIAEVSGGRVETRFALLFLKLAQRLGEVRPEGTFIPLALSRQDLADLTGTTIETAIRQMSRWAKEGLVVTEKDGFLLTDLALLERLASA